MKNSIVLVLVYILIAAGVGGLGIYVYNDVVGSDEGDNQPVQNEVPSVVSTTTGATNVKLDTIGDAGSYKIEVLPPVSGVVHPAIDRPIVFPPSFSTNAQNVMRKNISDAVATLKQNPSDTDTWLRLAIWRKMINDYKGAEEIWVYLTKVLKEPSYVYINLGDLYGYFLKDSVKAEYYFKESVRLEPENIEYYVKFAYYYIDLLKDFEKALGLVEEGYAKNSTGREFKNLLDQIKERVSLERKSDETSSTTSTGSQN